MTVTNAHDRQQSHLNTTDASPNLPPSYFSSSNRKRQSEVSNSHCRQMNGPLNIVLISAASVLILGLSSTIVTATPQYNKHMNTPCCSTSFSSCTTAFTYPKLQSTIRSRSTLSGWYPYPSHIPHEYRPYSSFLSASSEKDITTTDTDEVGKVSPMGVRKRVRTILQKAKNRTGIRNNSEEFLDYDYTTNGEYGFSINGDSNGQSEMDNEQVSNSYDAWMSVSNEFEKTQSSSRKIKTSSSVKTVVADAAAIGGLGAVLVDEETGKIDVALDYDPVETDPSDDTDEGSDAGESVVSSDWNSSNATDIVNGASAPATQPSSSPTKSKATSSEPKKKNSPASTYSKPINPPKPSLDDSLLPASSKKSKSSPRTAELDAFKGDVSAAFSMPPPPLPFTLPKLNRQQKNQLTKGERVQFQSDMGREGSGFVVVDVKAPANVVWECLLDFYSYPTTIPTVREIQMFTNTHLNQDYYSEKEVDRKKYEDGTYATLKHGVPSVTRAAFTLSKFRLKIAAIHKYRPHPQGDYMVFTLDPACTNLVLKNAKGVWHTETNPDGKGEEYTRVWLLCELKVSKLLPKWITDYAADRAMPRATTWIKPHVEAASELWLKNLED